MPEAERTRLFAGLPCASWRPRQPACLPPKLDPAHWEQEEKALAVRRSALGRNGQCGILGPAISPRRTVKLAISCELGAGAGSVGNDWQSRQSKLGARTTVVGEFTPVHWNFANVGPRTCWPFGIQTETLPDAPPHCAAACRPCRSRVPGDMPV
jgi:hypothetical protein